MSLRCTPSSCASSSCWGVNRSHTSGMAPTRTEGLKLKNVAITTGALTGPSGVTRVAKYLAAGATPSASNASPTSGANTVVSHSGTNAARLVGTGPRQSPTCQQQYIFSRTFIHRIC